MGHSTRDPEPTFPEHAIEEFLREFDGGGLPKAQSRTQIVGAGPKTFYPTSPMNLKASNSPDIAPAGCVVVLEPGARWPERAFADVADRDGVAVVHQSPGETAEHFFTRLGRQFTKLAANGVLIGTVLIACAVPGAVHRIDRNQLVMHVQTHALFARNGSVVFVDGAGRATRRTKA